MSFSRGVPLSRRSGGRPRAGLNTKGHRTPQSRHAGTGRVRAFDQWRRAYDSPNEPTLAGWPANVFLPSASTLTPTALKGAAAAVFLLTSGELPLSRLEKRALVAFVHDGGRARRLSLRDGHFSPLAGLHQNNL
jgi:hypothetical protein